MDKATIKFICNELRRATTTWDGRAECLRRARIQVLEGTYKNGKQKYKYYWKCAKCAELFRDEKSMEVDHIIEIGPFKGCLNDYAERMFCGQDNLQALCVGCHKKKTATNASLRFERKAR